MIETMSKLRNVTKKLVQAKGREPSVEEVAEATGITVEEAKRVMKISKHPISLDRPIGESDDSYFGDFIEDESAESPLEAAGQEMLKERIDDVLSTLTFREREIIKLRYGIGDGYTYTLEEVGRIFRVTRGARPSVHDRDGRASSEVVDAGLRRAPGRRPRAASSPPRRRARRRDDLVRDDDQLVVVEPRRIRR